MKVGFFLGFVPFAPVLPQIFLLIMLEVRVLGWLNVIWDERAAEEILGRHGEQLMGVPSSFHVLFLRVPLFKLQSSPFCWLCLLTFLLCGPAARALRMGRCKAAQSCHEVTAGSLAQV